MNIFKRNAGRLPAVLSASMVVGVMSTKEAYAGANSFTSIGQTITSQIGGLPGFVTAISYMMGIILAVTGILKIKDHVENPSNTPLKDGSIRLAAGGALFGVPLVTEAMQNLIGNNAAGVAAQQLQNVNTFNAVN